ncbi:MAG TPA: hypothetical protein VI796_00450 [Candidatus Thermoplasmatota archaeon]|nr:hypothetical protein [Candidatus Thermoplasmatota archaeon]
MADIAMKGLGHPDPDSKDGDKSIEGADARRDKMSQAKKSGRRKGRYLAPKALRRHAAERRDR